MRSLSGFDYVFINQGTNDARSNVAASTIQSDCQTMLANLRTACGSATIIFVVTPPAASYNGNLAVAVAAYKTSSGDPNVFAIDATEQFPSGAFGTTFPSGGPFEWTYDGVHPLIFGHARLGAAYAALAKAALTTSPSYSRTRLMNS
jgi:lysophospholipase L1-like esterase